VWGKWTWDYIGQLIVPIDTGGGIVRAIAKAHTPFNSFAIACQCNYTDYVDFWYPFIIDPVDHFPFGFEVYPDQPAREWDPM